MYEVKLYKLRDGRKLAISHDPSQDSPRDDRDNLGILRIPSTSRLFGGLSEDDSRIPPEDDPEIADSIRGPVLSVYGFSHTGERISCAPFSCPWDSGQIGWIYATAEAVEKMGTPENRIEECLRAEIEELDTWIRGDVFNAVLFEAPKPPCNECGRAYAREVLDACSSLYWTSDMDERGFLDYIAGDLGFNVDDVLGEAVEEEE